MTRSNEKLKLEVARLKKELRHARAEIRLLRRLDSEAARFVEVPISMRTHFTGEPPYVGWKGLGLALTEYMNEADRNLKKLAQLKSRASPSKKS